MPELKALARERELRGYSRLRKAELIALLQNNEHRAQSRHQRSPQMSIWEPNRPPQMSTWEPNRPPQRLPQMSTWEPECEWKNEVRQPELEALTKRQLKRMRNRNSKLAKKFKNLEKENDTKASKSTNARFKRKKIRSMKREADKIAEKLRKSEQALRLLEPRVPKDPISGAPLKQHPPSRNKCIEAKIADLNKKIRRAKNRRNKEPLMAKKEALKVELNCGPRQLDGAFGGAYR